MSAVISPFSHLVWRHSQRDCRPLSPHGWRHSRHASSPVSPPMRRVVGAVVRRHFPTVSCIVGAIVGRYLRPVGIVIGASISCFFLASHMAIPLSSTAPAALISSSSQMRVASLRQGRAVAAPPRFRIAGRGAARAIPAASSNPAELRPRFVLRMSLCELCYSLGNSTFSNRGPA